MSREIDPAGTLEMQPLALAQAMAEIATEAHPPGRIIGRYRLGHRLGQGASSTVYAAWDPELSRSVAIKLLRPDPAGTAGGSSQKARLRLQREAQAIARLSHPHVISVHDVGVHEDEVYVVMELVDGGTVRTWLAERRRSWRDILEVFLAAGRGLAAAHAAGLIHRDFKPDNILISQDGRVRVADFGLARNAGTGAEDDPARQSGQGGQPGAGGPGPNDGIPLEAGAAPLGPSLTQTGALVGTPTYMAPEQFLGVATDARTDQFSFCVTLYQALYGELPFGEGSLKELASRVVAGQRRPPPRRTSVPRWILPILLRGLSTLPADRFPSMAALLAGLEPERQPLRRYGPLGAAVLVLLLGVGVAFTILRGGRDAGPDRDQERPSRGAPLRRKLTTAGDVTEAAISSDGKTLAYVRDGRRLMLRDLDPTGSGAGDREVFRANSIFRLRWSPRGAELLYSVSPDPEKSGQWLLAGATSRHLGPGNLAAWAPDGARFAHARWADKGIALTHVKDGTTIVLPLAGPYEWITDIAWSPASERLLIETQHNDRFTLWTLRTDGLEQERLLAEADPCAPLWSRREGTFYYLRKRASDVAWLLSPSDGDGRPLASGPGLLKLIGWSGDGRWLYAQPLGQDLGGNRLMRISAQSGAMEPWVTLPFARTPNCATVTADGLHFVCTVSEGDSDAWRVDDFDEAPTGGSG